MEVMYAGWSLFRWVYVCVDVRVEYDRGSGLKSEQEGRRDESTDREE